MHARDAKGSLDRVDSQPVHSMIVFYGFEGTFRTSGPEYSIGVWLALHCSFATALALTKYLGVVSDDRCYYHQVERRNGFTRVPDQYTGSCNISHMLW